jgi:hypothetical protein
LLVLKLQGLAPLGLLRAHSMTIYLCSSPELSRRRRDEYAWFSLGHMADVTDL